MPCCDRPYTGWLRERFEYGQVTRQFASFRAQELCSTACNNSRCWRLSVLTVRHRCCPACSLLPPSLPQLIQVIGRPPALWTQQHVRSQQPRRPCLPAQPHSTPEPQNPDTTTQLQGFRGSPHSQGLQQAAGLFLTPLVFTWAHHRRRHCCCCYQHTGATQ